MLGKVYFKMIRELEETYRPPMEVRRMTYYYPKRPVMNAEINEEVIYDLWQEYFRVLPLHDYKMQQEKRLALERSNIRPRPKGTHSDIICQEVINLITEVPVFVKPMGDKAIQTCNRLGEAPLGLLGRAALEGQMASVMLLGGGSNFTREVLCSAHIRRGEFICTDKNGKATTIPCDMEEVYVVGLALSDGQPGGMIEFDPCLPSLIHPTIASYGRVRSKGDHIYEGIPNVEVTAVEAIKSNERFLNTRFELWYEIIRERKREAFKQRIREIKAERANFNARFPYATAAESISYMK